MWEYQGGSFCDLQIWKIMGTREEHNRDNNSLKHMLLWTYLCMAHATGFTKHEYRSFFLLQYHWTGSSRCTVHFDDSQLLYGFLFGGWSCWSLRATLLRSPYQERASVDAVVEEGALFSHFMWNSNKWGRWKTLLRNNLWFSFLYTMDSVPHIG